MYWQRDCCSTGRRFDQIFVRPKLCGVCALYVCKGTHDKGFIVSVSEGNVFVYKVKSIELQMATKEAGRELSPYNLSQNTSL